MLEAFTGKSAVRLIYMARRFVVKLIYMARRFVVTVLRFMVKLVVVLLILAVLCNVHDRFTASKKHLRNVYGREAGAD